MKLKHQNLGRIGAFAVLITMGAMWGLQFAMLKLASYGGYSEIDILMIALFCLSAIFTAITIYRKQMFRITFSRIRFLLIIAFLGYVAPLTAAIYAANSLPTGVLTLLASLTPVATIAFAVMLRTERISVQRLLAVVFGLLAILLVLWPELEAPGQGALFWMVVVLVVPICGGIESIYIAARWPTGLTALQVVTGETIVAAAMVIPAFAYFSNPSPLMFTWSSVEVAILVFVIAGVIESLLYFYLIQNTGGVFVSFGTFISLFAGIAWGIILFSESHGIMVWIAVTTLCISLILACFERPERISSSS